MTPTAVVGWFSPVRGMVVVSAASLVCAKAVALPAIRAFARKILVVVKVVLMKVSPVGLEQITIFVVTHQ